ncbi:uncharacterized protein AB9W97_004033 isoform 2-T2 [Spinachia spinachia]
MRLNRALRLSFLLLGLCQAYRARPPGGPYTTQEAGEVPMSQLRMLSLGMAHLLQGLGENVEQLERQGELVAAELEAALESLESLHKQSSQAGRTQRQAVEGSHRSTGGAGRSGEGAGSHAAAHKPHHPESQEEDRAEPSWTNRPEGLPVSPQRFQPKTE